MKELTGNKGEWSEVYVLIKLLHDLKLFSADEQLNKTTSYLEILFMLRKESAELQYLPEKNNINVIDVGTDNIIFTISNADLLTLSKDLFEEIKGGRGNSFSLSKNINAQLKKLSINKVKQGSTSKGDINIWVHDPSCGVRTQKKFSIKSFIGSDPTLFNANKTTNIIYEIEDSSRMPMSAALAAQINTINTNYKYIDRIKNIIDKGFTIKYKKYEEEIFLLNLELIDSKLPEIIAFAVLEKYINRITKMSDVIDNLHNKNPVKYTVREGYNFYEYKIINFLVEASLGMTSAVIWNGIHDATGGIIIVKDNSDVLCYHLVEFNKFKAYLKGATRLDNPSGGRMGYGEVYIEEGKSYIKLNFQVKA